MKTHWTESGVCCPQIKLTRLLAVLLTLSFLLPYSVFFLPPPASAATVTNWFNTSWNYRKRITFNNAAQAENLSNFPVLVKLTSSNFDFGKAQSTGADIRFTDSDGTTSLSYEIEKWDATNKQAFIWVNVPQIDASSSTDYVYMYYGNSTASDGQNKTSTWNSNYAGVWHLKETGNGTAGEFKDSTSNANSAQGGGGTASQIPTLSSSGKVDGAQSFDGSNKVDPFVNTVNGQFLD